MSGDYAYGQHEPTEPCPYCGTICCADFVDVGVGYTQCGPFHCDRCHASEIGSNDNVRILSEQERETGWYAPASEPGSSANVIGGRVVSHSHAEAAYRAEFVGNPLWEDEKYVADWWDKQREKP